MSLLDASRSALSRRRTLMKSLPRGARQRTADLATDFLGSVLLHGLPWTLKVPNVWQVQTRRAQLATLTRKYGADIAEVLEWAENSRARL